MPDALPLFPDLPLINTPPTHILGIGPWNPTTVWRGAKNYGLGPVRRPARPVMPLPPASSLSLTLRLNDGGEARADLVFTNNNAVVIEEMSTDLWWRRKDPRTGVLDILGRFNVSHVDMARSDQGLTASVQFEDYRTVLGERMVLRYKSNDPQAQDSQWDKNTPVTQIMRFAVPKNTTVDLSALDDDNLLGKTKEAFTLPPGSLISDVFDNLLAISEKPWEWWVETPNDINQFPKLSFTVGTRGRDKGVVLFDTGTGVSPIASWTMQAAADNYANALYFTGGAGDQYGGVVDIIPAQIEEFGQRDAQDGNTSLGGNLAAIKKAAARRIAEMADRRPTFTITLQSGYWRGRAHIDVGDTVRVLIKMGRELISESYRVSELTLTLDDSAGETIQLTLGKPLPSRNPRSRRSPFIRLVRKLKNYSVPPGKTDTSANQ